MSVPICATTARPSSKCSVGVEVGTEVGQWHTVGVLVVNAQTAAHIDVLHAQVVALQLVLQLIHAVTQGLEVAHVENLRADVKV